MFTWRGTWGGIVQGVASSPLVGWTSASHVYQSGQNQQTAMCSYDPDLVDTCTPQPAWEGREREYHLTIVSIRCLLLIHTEWYINQYEAVGILLFCFFWGGGGGGDQGLSHPPPPPPPQGSSLLTDCPPPPSPLPLIFFILNVVLDVTRSSLKCCKFQKFSWGAP